MEVIDIMKNGGHSAGAAAAVFDDCYFLACEFPWSGNSCCRHWNDNVRACAKVVHVKLGSSCKLVQALPIL